MEITHVAVFLGAAALAVALPACSDGQETKAADCARINTVVAAPVTDLGNLSAMYLRSASQLRAMKPHLKDDKAASLADEWARAFDAQGRYEIAHPNDLDQVGSVVNREYKILRDRAARADIAVELYCGRPRFPAS
jgi:hypothetical protein